AIDNYAADLKAAAAKRRAAALADAKVRENKRVVSEGLAAKRSLLQFREDCAADVFAEVRRRVLVLHDSAGYAGTLQDQLLRALSAVPGAQRRRELRHEDMARAADLAAAAPGVELKFVEGAFTLGGLVLDCAEAGRKIDLTFDAALEDLEGRFSEITGFSLEDADGK
ncbi:MAG: V-type ATP synthase subunit E family protein, partial [Oscillospiraceae bacterium]